MINNTGIWVIIPNWNGGELTIKCLKSLQDQTKKHNVIVVDNASEDNSVELIEKSFPNVQIIQNERNLGFAGGVNVGIKEALEQGAEYIVLLNNDVTLEKNWLVELEKTLKAHKKAGAATGKLLDVDGKKVDNTGDEYSIWGLTIPRERDLPAEQANDQPGEVFGACAGAAMYRAKAVRDVGLFDEKFFAYFEDTDYNFRLQLLGWKAMYEPEAIGYHATGSTSGKLAGFTRLQTAKNLPMLFWKNMPLALLPRTFPRFFLVYGLMFFGSVAKGQGWPVLKGVLLSTKNLPHAFIQRYEIQRKRKASNAYIWSILYKDLPPNSKYWQKLRSLLPGKTG
ncbi:MAG TPA: glycosyltransferase family 2 protein [Candidatus Saccharimonadales bacterium]|nr:glycosyltransferase family 2 protein [Candidatus Saccharimonadales bacterium]